MDFGVPQRLSKDDIGPAGLRGHKQLVHGGDHLSELTLDGSSAPAAFGQVTRQPAPQSKPGRAVDEDGKVKQTPNGRLQQEPKAFDQDQRLRMPQLAPRGGGVPFKIVTGSPADPASPAILEELLEAGPIDGARVVVID